MYRCLAGSIDQLTVITDPIDVSPLSLDRREISHKYHLADWHFITLNRINSGETRIKGNNVVAYFSFLKEKDIIFFISASWTLSFKLSFSKNNKKKSSSFLISDA